jgi:hypothetical protein
VLNSPRIREVAAYYMCGGALRGAGVLFWRHARRWGISFITKEMFQGARSVPGARSPWLLTCAPLGRDIAIGVADRSVIPAVPALGGAYRRNSDQDLDSECGRSTPVYGCSNKPQKQPCYNLLATLARVCDAKPCRGLRNVIGRGAEFFEISNTG